MKHKELIKLPRQQGFVFIRQSGSHAIYRKTEHKPIVVPIHSRGTPTDTLRSILKDAGIK